MRRQEKRIKKEKSIFEWTLSLRTAYANELSLDREQTTHNDLFGVSRLVFIKVFNKNRNNMSMSSNKHQCTNCGCVNTDIPVTSVHISEYKYNCTNCGFVNMVTKAMLILPCVRMEIHDKDSLELPRMALNIYAKGLETHISQSKLDMLSLR